MLPDFPQIKATLQRKVLDGLMEDAKRRSGIMAMVPQIRIFEGDNWAYTTEEPSLIDPTSSLVTVTNDQLESNTIEENVGLLKQAVDDLVDQMSARIMETARDAAENGHVKFVLSEEITPSGILDMMEKFEMDFTPDGMPIIGQIISQPSLKKDFELIFSDADFRKKWDIMIEKQREAYSDRESHRKLVG